MKIIIKRYLRVGIILSLAPIFLTMVGCAAQSKILAQMPDYKSSAISKVYSADKQAIIYEIKILKIMRNCTIIFEDQEEGYLIFSMPGWRIAFWIEKIDSNRTRVSVSSVDWSIGFGINRQGLALNILDQLRVPQNNNAFIANKADSTTAKLSIYAEKNPPVSSPKSDIDVLPSIKVKPNNNFYAIVIGIENYRQKLPVVDFATADARIVTEYLTKVMGYPKGNVITLTNENASKSDFEKYFEKWLSNNVEKDSTVFVYYSGHGAPNPKKGDAYLVPYDGDPSFIEQTGYSLKRLYESLNKLKAKEIIVALDSCFSGAGGRSVLAKGARPLVMILQSNVVLSRNITVMAASAGNQISSTYDEKGHGLFTYFMLKGIKNEDVVRQDGSIKMDDLFGYIKPQVERIARKQFNNEQTPQLIGAKQN
jgi:hypothetical protein